MGKHSLISLFNVTLQSLVVFTVIKKKNLSTQKSLTPKCVLTNHILEIHFDRCLFDLNVKTLFTEIINYLRLFANALRERGVVV